MQTSSQRGQTPLFFSPLSSVPPLPASTFIREPVNTSLPPSPCSLLRTVAVRLFLTESISLSVCCFVPHFSFAFPCTFVFPFFFIHLTAVHPHRLHSTAQNQTVRQGPRLIDRRFTPRLLPKAKLEKRNNDLGDGECHRCVFFFLVFCVTDRATFPTPEEKPSSLSPLPLQW